METTRLSPKGQIVIPHRIREQLGWHPGVEFTVEMIADGIALHPIKQLTTTTTEDAYGCLRYKGKRKSLQDMEDGIRKGTKART